MNDLFHDKEIKQILALNAQPFYCAIESMKLNALRSVEKMFNEYPLLYGIAIGGLTSEIKSIPSGQKFSNTSNPFISGSPGHLAKLVVSLMSSTTPNIVLDENLILGACVDFLAPGTMWELKIQKQIKEKDFYNYCREALIREQGKVLTNQGTVTHKEMKAHFKNEFSYLSKLNEDEQKEFMKGFEKDQMGNRFKKINIRNLEGNINKNFKDEVYDFLGDDLMKKINYNLLNNQLGEKPKTKLRKI